MLSRCPGSNIPNDCYIAFACGSDGLPVRGNSHESDSIDSLRKASDLFVHLYIPDSHCPISACEQEIPVGNERRDLNSQSPNRSHQYGLRINPFRGNRPVNRPRSCLASSSNKRKNKHQIRAYRASGNHRLLILGIPMNGRPASRDSTESSKSSETAKRLVTEVELPIVPHRSDEASTSLGKFR